MPDESRPTDVGEALSAQEHEALTSGSTLRLAELALARGEDERRRRPDDPAPARAAFAAAATLFRLAGEAARADDAARRAGPEAGR